MSAIQNPKEEKPKYRWIGLDQIKVDYSVQSREKMSVEDQKEFSEAMLRGDEFPAITLYFDGRYYWLADGFHRLAAAKAAMKANPKLCQIKAEIKDGSKRDAIIFSAGANKKFSIKRTKADIKRSITMILDDRDGFRWTAKRIAKYVGTGVPVVQSCRLEYCSNAGVDLPDELLDINDNVFIPDMSKRPRIIQKRSKGAGRPPGFYTRVDGKSKWLGGTLGKAKSALDAIKVTVAAKEETPRETLPTNFRGWFSARGIQFVGHAEVGGYNGNGILVYPSDITGLDDLSRAIGKLVLLRKLVDPDNTCNLRSVVACYKLDCQSLHASLSRQAGIEFLTPEELVASIKGEDGEGASVASPEPSPQLTGAAS